MKIPYLYLALSLVLFVAGFALGQDSREAVLVDEHGSLPCDDTLGRLDIYFSELSKDPGAAGIVVLSAPKQKKHVSVFRQYLVQGHVKSRDFKSNPIKYIRSNFGDESRVQLWRIPAGADEPQAENTDMSYTLPKEVKPFMLAREYEIEDPICPGVDALFVFSEFLKGNPTSRGNIVVRERTVDRAQREADRILLEFQKKYGIPRSRLRVFPRKSSFPYNNLEPIVEYWYLP